MASRDLTVHIIGDSRSLERAFKQAGRTTDTFAAKSSRALRNIGFGAAIAGTTALTAAVKIGIDEFSEQAKVAAQTNAVLKSTGGVANVTARQVDNLSRSLSRQSGIDDELIQRGANLLLTFKQVRNEVGKGNNVFDRATQAALDLSVAGFGSVETTAKQLGKALNDPVRGMTALGRAGVTFTAGQRKQIKALVEANRTLDAQKLILREVESQVGGSARALGETLPGQLAKLRVEFQNFLGGAVAKAVPLLERFAARAVDALDQIRAWVRENEEPLRRIWTQASEAVRIFAAIVGPVLGPALRVVAASLSIQVQVLAKVAQAWRFLAGVVQRVIGGVLDAVDKFLGGLTQLTDAASHLPFVGDQFKGVSDKVNAARDRLRDFTRDLRAIGDETISVEVRVGVTGAGSLPEAADHLRGVAKATREAQAAAAKTERAPRVTAEQRNQFFDARISRRLDRTQDQALRQQLASLDRIAQAIEAQIAKVRDVTRKLTLRDKLLEVQRQMRAVRDQLADAFVSSVRLGLDRAGLTAGVADDLAALNELERALQQQIAVSGETVELERELIGIEQQRAQIRQQQRQAVSDALQLRFDRAALTESVADDLRALEGIERDVRAQIAAEGRTLDLERQLLDIARQRADLLEQRRDQLKRARDARQFRSLGLTATGDEAVPGVKALRQQLGNLSGAIQGTFLDTSKTKSLLARIRRVLSGGLGAVSRDVRETIARMLADIDRQLGEKRGGQHTKFRVLNTDQVLAGLGLSPDQTRAARARLAKLGMGGTATVGGRAAFGQPVAAGSGNVIVTGPVTVVADNPDAFMRELQKKNRRRAQQTTGAYAGNAGGFVR